MLEDDEAHPAAVINRDGPSAFFFVCEHASRKIPRGLGTLGLDEADLERHIAWDIGAASVARQLADAFDATLVLQRYSRLVIDCNRPPRTSAAMPEVSETTAIPGNAEIGEVEQDARIAGIFDPFHDTIAGLGLAASPATTLLASPQPKRILILGGTGFIGPNTVRYAMARGHQVSIFTRGRRETELPEGVERLVGEAVPYGRMGRPGDMVGAAVFLASSDADYILAQTLNVDGGNWMS